MIKYVFLVLYLVIMIWVGIRSSRKIKTTGDFFVAGKRGSLWQVTGSMLATILGSSAILGTVNLAYLQGWAASWLMLSAAAGFIVLIPLAKYVSRFGKYTLPQLVGDFYGPKAKTLASVIIPLAWIGIVAAQIIGAAKIMNSFFGLGYGYGVMGSGLVFVFYTLIGGQVSILKTDQFQALFILTGVLVSAVYIFLHFPVAPMEMTPLGFPFNQHFDVLDLLVLLLSYSTTFVVGPDIYSRLFCANSEETARKSVRLSAIILIPFAFLITYLGVFASYQYPNLDYHTGSALIPVIIHVMPEWGIGLMMAALLSAVMSSADTTLLTASIIISDPISKGLDTKNSLLNTRLTILGLGGLSILLALEVTSIIQVLLIALAVFSGAFIVPTAAGLLGFRTSEKRSTAAMAAGSILALAGKIYSLYGDRMIGNWIIISAFAVNAIILFSGRKKRDVRHQTQDARQEMSKI